MSVKVFRSWKGHLWALLLIAACLAAFPAAAFAEVVDDDPAAASNGPGNVSIAMRDSSGNLVTRAWTGTQWSPWAALTGMTLTSGPSIDIRPGPITDVFARGPDNAIYHRYFVPGNGWSEWGSIGGCATSAPASSWRGNGWLDVVVRGCDGAVWFKTWSAATGWLSWISLGGGISYHPAIKSYANGTISVYAVGTDHQLYQDYYNGTWSGWMPLGGYLTSGPTLSTQTESTIDVFAKDGNNNIAQRSWNGSSWSNWVWIPTSATSGPAAVAEGPGRVDLFVRGGGDLYMNQFFSGSWHGWTSQFSSAPPGPPVSGSWTLKFSDEFNSAGLNTNAWTNGYPDGANDISEKCVSPKRASQPGDGYLHLTVAYEPATCGNPSHTAEWAGAAVTTDDKFEYTYGYVEWRVYWPGSAGSFCPPGGCIKNHPTVWSFSPLHDTEIDVAEGPDNYSACSRYHHWANEPSGAVGHGACYSNVGGGWHVFGADWEPGVIRFYYEGQKVGEVPNEDGLTPQEIATQPHHLIASYTASRIRSASEPAESKIDWVRVWAHS